MAGELAEAAGFWEHLEACEGEGGEGGGVEQVGKEGESEGPGGEPEGLGESEGEEGECDEEVEVGEADGVAEGVRSGREDGEVVLRADEVIEGGGRGVGGWAEAELVEARDGRAEEEVQLGGKDVANGLLPEVNALGVELQLEKKIG